jgi:putative ABC transport system ATP-binding protein
LQQQQKSLVVLDNVDRFYDMGGKHFYALKGISLSINAGEFAGLVGPSGSGKTTLLNLIDALDQPSGGRLQVLGRDVSKLTNKEAADIRSESIGFIFQHYQLFPVYSVYENVEFPLLLLGRSESERKTAVMDALSWVGLADRRDSKPAQLSGGQCQRVAIARAMVKRPTLVLADEPTANIDAENSHSILKTMVQLNKDLGTTFLFSTHDEKVIGYLRRKISLDDGVVIADERMDGGL